MPPRTRNQGAPPGGHLQVETPKRERKPIPKPASLLAGIPVPVVMATSYKHASAQTEINLTNFPARTPGKRARDETDDSNDEHNSKRVQSERAARFPFNSSSNPSFRRSLNHGGRRPAVGIPSTPSRTMPKTSRLAQSARLPSKYAHESTLDLPALKPTGVRKTSREGLPVETPEEKPSMQQNSPGDSPRAPNSERPPQTPSHPPSSIPENSNGWWGSLRRIFTRTPSHEMPTDVNQPQQAQMDTVVNDEGGQEGDPAATESSFRRPTNIFGTPQRQSRPAVTAEHFRRRRQGLDPDNLDQPSHSSARAPSPEFASSTPGSKKRKANTDGFEIYEARNPGFSSDFDEGDPDGSAVNDAALPTTPLSHKQTSALHTPLKSAMKSGNRSAKRARFDENLLSSSKPIYGNYGRAGDYRGSTFANPLDKNNSFSSNGSLPSVVSDGFVSPTTNNNTMINASATGRVSVFNTSGMEEDDGWRPTAANPRRGHFCVPDLDDPDPDEEESGAENNPSEGSATSAEPPSTPRMAHAELPSTTPADRATSPTLNEDGVVQEATELKLNKARLEAQKYKPKDSSRLSSVTQARSRSSSPPASRADGTDPPRSSATPIAVDADKENQGVPLSKTASKSRPKVLDNNTRGDDGMTDYEREHQFDSWASEMDWPKPQTYEDAGVVSPFISDLLRRRWNEEDEKRSHAFWQKEFEEVDKAMNDARQRGLRLELVADNE